MGRRSISAITTCTGDLSSENNLKALDSSDLGWVSSAVYPLSRSACNFTIICNVILLKEAMLDVQNAGSYAHLFCKLSSLYLL